MGFRFRRSVKILPGVRINLGKRTTTISVGGRGAHVTLRPGHTIRSTVGIPGTGISYTQGGGGLERYAKPTVNTEPPAVNSRMGWSWVVIVLGVIVGMALYITK